jgi:hydrophobic/amphiphilic exporter-1 (mainly G- bacteria), HAE1 family
VQKLAEICIQRPVFAAMIVLSLVVVGSASYFKLGVDRFPAVDLPTVTVRTTLPGASPEEIETLVSQRIEEVVNTVDGIDNLRSVSVQGASIIIATFKLNRDIDTAAQDVRDRVATVIRDLPPDAKPPVISKVNNDTTPVITIALSGPHSIRELTEYADNVVKVQLERSTGVGEVDVVGGLDRAINVWIDAQRLAAYKIPITAVYDALQRQNSDVPGGNVETGRRELVLRTLGRYTEPRDMEDLVVADINGSPVKIRDIGRIEDGTKEERSIARLNGVRTVTLEVQRQSGANTVEVINNIKTELEKVKPQLPGDLKLEVIRDQSRYIDSALHEITHHLVLGSILASLVVLLFMRSWRSTLIAAIAIPASVVSTFGMMRALNFTLNGVTMLALVLMVGVVIDDAIVVLENIFRFVEEKRITPMRAAGRDLSSGLFHVLDLRALSVSIRHYGCGGGTGVVARLIHLDADDERAFVARQRRRIRPRIRAWAWASTHGGRRHFERWFLCVDRSFVHLAVAPFDAAPVRGGNDCPGGRAFECPALSGCQTGIHTDRC